MTEELEPAEEAVNPETTLKEAHSLTLEEAFNQAPHILKAHLLGVQQERDALLKIIKIVKVALE